MKSPGRQESTRKGRNSLLFRRITASFAALGLLAHGLAMLVGAALMPAGKAEAAALPGFMEICTPQGIVLRAFPDASAPPAGESPPPDSGGHQVQECPVCSAFSQNAAGMPACLALIDQSGVQEPPLWLSYSLVQVERAQRPQTRAPPPAG